MLEKLAEYQSQLEQIDVQLADGATMKDMNLYKKLAQERSQLQPIVDELTRLKEIADQIADAKELLKEETDSEMIALTREELESLENALEKTTTKGEKTSSWRFGQAPAETKRLSSPPICFGCIRIMPTLAPGRWISSPPMRRESAVTRN